jgi:hypothetical protein
VEDCSACENGYVLSGAAGLGAQTCGLRAGYCAARSNFAISHGTLNCAAAKLGETCSTSTACDTQYTASVGNISCTVGGSDAGSGVWGKREWVMPGVTDDAIVSTGEGGTNLFWAERLGKEIGLPDLWVKQCGNSHTGSFKDLGMTVLVSMVKEMIARGVAIPAVACASTGGEGSASSSSSSSSKFWNLIRVAF